MNVIHHIFLEILERYYKLILGTLGMPGFAHPKWYNQQLLENLCVDLQAKNKINHPYFSGDIAKICKLVILDTLCKPGYARPKW